jgi:hypothetical protein
MLDQVWVNRIFTAKIWLGLLGKPLWVVADGAYAKKDLLKPAKALGMTVVSRLRRDAALRTVPGPRPWGRARPGPDLRRPPHRSGQAGRPAPRVDDRRVDLYRERAVKRYKTFLATWRPAGGVIRVVLVDEPTSWVAYFCTDPSVSVTDILAAVADRFSLETTFRDCKEIVGAGQQQVRFVWASVGAFHVCLWTFTMTEAWAWGLPAGELVDRSASPWDDANCRPSHADKRRAWRRALLREEILAVLRGGMTDGEIQSTADRVLSLAA